MCNTNKRTPHKHADVIKAWADGHKIQYKGSGSRGWVDWPHMDSPPSFTPWGDYRIKPEPSDLEKYGVEVGDVWTLTDECGKFFVKYEPVLGKKVCLQNLYGGEGYSAWSNVFQVLMFRRGVVNKL